MAMPSVPLMAKGATNRTPDDVGALLLAERHMVSLLVRPAGDLHPARGAEGKYKWEEKVQATRVPGVARIIVTIRWRSRGRSMSFELVSLREAD
jgi:hypothetical protein